MRTGLRRTARACVAVLVLGLAIASTVLLTANARSDARQTERQAFLDAARRAVLDVTTMSSTTLDADIERLRASSTGVFLADFDTRAEEYASTVRAAEVVSVGEIVEAGIESVDGDTARVLVRATSTVTNSAGAEHDPRTWRLRVTMERTPDGILMADLDYVP